MPFATAEGAMLVNMPTATRYVEMLFRCSLPPSSMTLRINESVLEEGSSPESFQEAFRSSRSDPKTITMRRTAVRFVRREFLELSEAIYTNELSKRYCGLQL